MRRWGEKRQKTEEDLIIFQEFLCKSHAVSNSYSSLYTYDQIHEMLVLLHDELHYWMICQS